MTATITIPPSFGYPAGHTVTITGSGSYITAVLYRYYTYGVIIP